MYSKIYIYRPEVTFWWLNDVRDLLIVVSKIISIHAIYYRKITGKNSQQLTTGQ